MTTRSRSRRRPTMRRCHRRRRLSRSGPDADRARRSRRACLMISGDGEGLVDAADVGLLDGAGVIRYSASYADRDRSCARRLARTPCSWSPTRTGCAHGAGRSVRDNVGFTEQAGGADAPLKTDLGDARLDVFPGEAPTPDDDRRQRRAAGARHLRTATRSRTRPRTAPRWRSTAIRRPHGDAARSATRSANGSASTSTADHDRSREPRCSRSTVGATGSSRRSRSSSTAITRPPWPSIRVASLHGPGQHVTFGRAHLPHASISVSPGERPAPQPVRTGRRGRVRRDPAARRAARRTTCKSPSSCRCRPISSTRWARRRPTTRSCSSCSATPCGRCRRRAQPELSITAILHAPASTRLPAHGQCDGRARTRRWARSEPRSVRIRTSMFAASAIHGRLPGVPARRRHSTATRQPRGRRRSTPYAGSGSQYSVPKPISFDHLDLQSSPTAGTRCRRDSHWRSTVFAAGLRCRAFRTARHRTRRAPCGCPSRESSGARSG